MTAMLLDRQRHLADVDLLDHPRREGEGGPQVIAAGGAGVEAVIEGPAVEGLGREGDAFVLGMAGLPADAAFVLALRWRRLGWLDEVGGRGLGRRRGVLARRGELLAQLGDDLLEGGEFRLQDIHSRLEPSAIGAADRVLGSHGGLFYMPCDKGTTPVNGHGQRKDDIAKEHHARSSGTEGIVFVGKAQEKTPVFGTEKRRNPDTGQKYPWIVRRTSMVNHFYFYGLDSDFGPFFLKVCTYFPYNAKLCINGHEYVKRQLAKEGIAFEALDNGILSCANPRRLQQLCDGLSATKVDALVRKWLRRLPHPFTAKDRAAGYRYDVSILQAEFSLTQVLDRPLSGRIFFEEGIRENLDLGRPDQVQLIFVRRVTKRTPGRFRTRVLTEGVTPSLHVDYKHSRIKQYPKEGRALRTETTVNDTRDFGIGKRLCNLPALRRLGFQANRRLLDVQRISQDCAVGED